MYCFRMQTLSLDLRQRILDSYDEGEGTRQEIADRYRVSLGMVKKLLSQRKRTGDIAPRHSYSGRKPYFTQEHRLKIKELIDRQPDITLYEIREQLKLNCTVQAIHYVLKEMGMTFKKKRFTPASKDAKTFDKRVLNGLVNKKTWI